MNRRSMHPEAPTGNYTLENPHGPGTVQHFPIFKAPTPTAPNTHTAGPQSIHNEQQASALTSYGSGEGLDGLFE